MVGFILWESYQRVLQPVDIGTGPTLLIAIGGLLLNLVSVHILHGGELSLNEQGAMYHLLGDAGGSAAVIVSVIAIEVTGITLIDPVVAALIAVLILYSAGRVLRGSSAIFLLRNPLEMPAIRDAIETVEGVKRIDDLHVWQICSQITVATVHIETSVETMAAAEAVTEEVHRVLGAHGVDHATVELCPSYAERQTLLNAHDH
jgi:cobalt-zinc-cadmium efflux system protein